MLSDQKCIGIYVLLSLVKEWIVPMRPTKKHRTHGFDKTPNPNAHLVVTYWFLQVSPSLAFLDKVSWIGTSTKTKQLVNNVILHA